MVVKPEDDNVSLETVAEKMGTSTQMVADHKALVLPSDVYLCDLDGKVFVDGAQTGQHGQDQGQPWLVYVLDMPAGT